MLESAETFKADSHFRSSCRHHRIKALVLMQLLTRGGGSECSGTVIVVMITGAGWLYQKNGEWPVPAAQDPRNAAHKQTPAAAATPSGQNSVAERVRNPSDVASPPSLLTPSTPPMQSRPSVAEPSAAPEPDPPLPETVDTEADRGSYHAGTDAPPHAPPPVGTPPAGRYTIQRGDTLIAIAAHFYGNASQWSVIAQANPEVDSRRLRVGQEIKLLLVLAHRGRCLNAPQAPGSRRGSPLAWRPSPPRGVRRTPCPDDLPQ